ncbi:MFS transporter [Raineyella antarctica]|uniref:MFS transporter n=1 Tax=Raineyella antarctica TaxID=1577474 RepID=UPI001FDED6C5|nr:MFS transporter [Raineyella antarctica]
MTDRNVIRVEGVDRTFHRYKILFVLMVPIAMALMAISSINVALPSVEQGLGATASDVQWILSGYALTFGITLIPAGRIGDSLGRGMFFVMGLALFTLASLACGLAPDPATLNAARFVQGIGAGLYNPQVMGMIQQFFSGRGRAKAFALLGMVISVSVAVGPLLAGSMIAWLGPQSGWRASFLVNVPIGLAGVVLALIWLPFGRERRRFRRSREIRAARAHGDTSRLQRSHLDLDPVGSVMMAAAVLCVMFPFTAHGSPWWWLLVPVGLGLIVAWIAWEKRYKARGHEPMVDLALFSYHSFSYGSAVTGTFFVGSTSIFVIAALFVQQGLGASAFAAGLVTLPNAIVSAGAAAWSGRHTLSRGRVIVVASIVTIIIACLGAILVASLVVGSGISWWWLALPWAVAGLGQGALGSANQTLTLEDVPTAVGGTAGGVMSTAQRMGTAIGSAVITSIFFAAFASTGAFTALRDAYLLISAVLVVSALVALADLRSARARGVRH